MSQGLTGAVSGAAARAASTASAATVTLPAAPLVATYPISGTTTITSIVAGQSGAIAILEFASASCQVTNGSNLKLIGDYVSTVLGTLTLECDGTNWIEVCRSGASSPQNSIVNNDFSVWQRWTSVAAMGNGTFIADRWNWVQVGTAVVTGARDTSVPAVGPNAINTPYSLKISIPATADASIAAGDLYVIRHGIEGFDYRPLTNGMALSFWVKAHRTGIYCVSATNRGSDRSYVAEYTINVADTWEYKTIVIPTPPTAGTWDYTTLVGLYLDFALAAGSTFQTTAGTWQTGNFFATANQVNGVGATTDTFSLALTNNIPGSVALPCMPLPYALQLERAMRYCQKYSPGNSGRYGPSANDSTTTCIATIALPVPMLAVPTATFTVAGTFWLYSNGSVFTPTGIAASSATNFMFVFTMSGMAGLTNGGAGLILDQGGSSSILLEANPT